MNSNANSYIMTLENNDLKLNEVTIEKNDNNI